MTKPKERAAQLTATRNAKMARSAHAYVRGSTVEFYRWLETCPADVPEGPPVWICGDCHLGNLGPLADKDGYVEVQVRDLDQTVIGNPAHDLIRLALSLASAARGSDLPGVTTARILEHLMVGYEAGLAGDFDRRGERATRPEIIAKLVRRSVGRRWRHLAEERLESVQPTIPLGPKFWAVTKAERRALSGLFDAGEIRGAITALQARGADDSVALLDAAYWLKGCSSLGRLRFAAMLRVGQGAGSSLCLVDIKEGVLAAAPRSDAIPMPRDNAKRVVAGARALSPNLGERMIAARFMDKAVVIRELMPQDLKLEIQQMTQRRATGLARYLGAVVGKAHGRQMAEEDRAAWAGELARRRTRSLDAPQWLWSSVVTLLGIHEAAYLEHCRRFALARAA